jgi:hypothetical protein
MSDDLSLSLDAFVRSVGINKATPHALMLGAGASITSGVPSAADCIWEWKRSIFLTNNPGLEAQFSELSLVAVRSKIQRWLDAQGKYPANEGADEYAFYIQECFPIAEDRRAFFQDKIQSAVPFVGYRLLPKLAKAGLIKSVWTPNFDGLAARASASQQVTAIEVGIDCSERVFRRPNRNELLCVSLHGDYRYDRLKNTSDELQEQDETLRAALVEEIQHTPLVVVGYSGRDVSLMTALRAGYGKAGTGALYWCGYGEGEAPPQVAQLIQSARKAGRSAFYISSGGFDDLLTRVALHLLEPVEADEARRALQPEPDSAGSRANFSLPELLTCGLIKSNAFALSPPGEIYEFSLHKWPAEKVWEYFDESTRGKMLVAAPFRGKGYAFGSIDDVRTCFGTNLGARVERVPINDRDLTYEDSVISSLIRRALVIAFAQRAGLETDRHALLWRKAVLKRVSEAERDFVVHEAVIVYLRRIESKSYVVLKPTVKIEAADGSPVPKEVERDLKAGILGWQHNAEFNQAIENWRKVLMERERYEFPPNAGSPFTLQVQKKPVLAKLTSRDRTRQIQIQQKYAAGITQLALELPEPKLIFSNRGGDGQISDTHPVRGIVRNRPFDYPLTSRHLAADVQLGVVCPAQESRKLASFLDLLHGSLVPGQYESDYLLPFPGFESAFGVALRIPRPGDSSWITCPDVDAGVDPPRGAHQLGRHLTASLAKLHAASSPSVTVIFIPTRWSKWRSFETESERFDLHNFVKAFGVPQGIATQFLEEDTLANSLQCRVRWWLALALYVKSMRTPWVLEALDPDSAFVGIGMSLDRKSQAGSQVILGCSHLYDAQGQGLQFRLSKIENPIIRRRNAFMSFDDARRVGETIRQLFWESRFRLPRRVVVHKLTPFLEEERRGLRAGLSGVKEIELLEIFIDDAIRYLSSVPQKDGSFREDRFPMRRGTIVRLAEEMALIWVHGVSNVTEGKRNYYQGKRRIPAPLVIRRHGGHSSLAAIGAEILGLSKMNWNSFDLYAKLPATIESSRQIARIGSLLERFGSTSYDYRLFM